MHKHPFDLLCVRLLDEHEQPVFKHPLWLKVHGQRRRELSAQELYLAYLQRADLEHFWRFGKPRLLLASFQTPETEHEESWLQLVQLAYTQLYLMHSLLATLPRPWERYLPAANYTVASPTQALRQAASILCQIGTPAQPPKPREIPSGRPPGFKPTPRSRPPVVKKPKKPQKGSLPLDFYPFCLAFSCLSSFLYPKSLTLGYWLSQKSNPIGECPEIR